TVPDCLSERAGQGPRATGPCRIRETFARSTRPVRAYPFKPETPCVFCRWSWNVMNADWEAVIGLEVHCQLRTKSKIFTGASTEYGAEPNTQADPVTLGLPGVLPVLNHDALQMAVKFGLAVGAEIA